MSHYLIGVKTDKGRKRSHNEDSFSLPARNLSPKVLAQRGFLVVVADGVGGQAAGEIASQVAVRRLQAAYYSLPFQDVRDTLRQAVAEANQAVWENAQRRDQAGMASTIVAAVLRGNELTTAHVGDSRAYLIGPAGVQQLTRDHTVVNELVASGALTEAEAAVHPRRHVISRSLGSQAEVKVATAQGPLGPGDTLLLCTDGLSNQVSDEKVAEVVRKNPPQAAAGQLVALANAAGGIDNVTALIVRPVIRGHVADTVTGVLDGVVALVRRLTPIQAFSILGGIAMLAMITLLAAGMGRDGEGAQYSDSNRQSQHTSASVVPPTNSPVAQGTAVQPALTLPPSATRAKSGFPRPAYLESPRGETLYLYKNPDEQLSGIDGLILPQGTKIIITGPCRTGTGVYGSKCWYPTNYTAENGKQYQGYYVPCKYVKGEECK